MILVKADWIPLTKVLNELVVVLNVFDVTAEEVASTPFTVLEIVLPVVDRVLVVLLARALASEVVAVTPFTVELRTEPAVLKTLELMMLVELATPFTVEVSVLAEELTPLLEITEDVAVTPLIVVVKVLLLSV